MNPGGDAAEQVVRMSLEGVEVAARITGTGAKNIAILLAAVLKEEQKTRGKARMTNMLKSGKELKVYSIRQKDLKTFAKEAKRYGVLYCVLKDKNSKDGDAVVDVMARADDASKIQRITERFRFDTVDRATVIGEIAKEKGAKAEPSKAAEKMIPNPSRAQTENVPLSERSSKQTSRSGSMNGENSRESVREKLNGYKSEAEKSKAARTKTRSKGSRSTARKAPNKNKAKGR
ncbi:MAG: PcfB family protein [Clostridiales bacterium]|jgi:hypothetical protein|nr:PcfB family protein [Candidatus Micrarchaeota archaeon]NLT47256.1 PcfB family protein [Clostridiales bacterium]